MEELPVRPLGERVPAAAAALGRESWAMAGALARGDVGRDAIRATRITRQTIRGKDGGVYYVLAPGPSVLLAPTLRLDRTINRVRGEPGRVAASVLLWCALAALLVTAVFRLLRDATGRPGLAAALALAFALVPPFLFYSFQFYPEMIGALVLAVAFRTLALRRDSLARHPWLHGWLFATLPWLHQKFLPVWLVLVATAIWAALSSRGTALGASSRGTSVGPVPRDPPSPAPADASAPARDGAPRDDGVPPREGGARLHRLLAGLIVPTLVGLYLTALYNFAVTGSVRPDALFLAWGPGGVTSARVGQGVLGLLLDARYGILPYVPVLLLAGGGLVAGGARRFAVVIPAAAVYYLTVASADNWAGAVCNLGRYFMPIAPLAVALVGIAIGRAGSARAIALAAGSEKHDPATADPSSHGTTELVRMTDGTGLVGMTDVPRGFLALVLVLCAWTAVFARALWLDPHAANDSALLLAKSTYADGHQYVPDLFIRRWADAAPGLWARAAAWLAGIGVIAWWTRRIVSPNRGTRGGSPLGTLAAVTAAVLCAGLALERWPGERSAPSFGDALRVPGSTEGPAAIVFLRGAARLRYDEAVVGPGRVELLLRSPAAVSALTVTVGGQGSFLEVEGRLPIVLRPTGALVSVPFVSYHRVRGRDGGSVAFARATLNLEGEAVLRLGQGPAGDAVTMSPPGGEMEPEGSPDR
jgi:hypothetical protein